MNKELLLKLFHWPRPYMSGTDFMAILDKSSHSRHGIIKRAVKESHLLPLRRDLFLIKDTKTLVNAFELALIIYGPSYVSFESALSYHGWIPEAVMTTTSATVKRAKEFVTPLGLFTYEHVPMGAFSLAIEQHSRDNVTLFIASPFKAIADLIYVRKKHWKTCDNLTEDLRIDSDSIEREDRKVLDFLIENYPCLRVKKSLKSIKKSMP